MPEIELINLKGRRDIKVEEIDKVKYVKLGKKLNIQTDRELFLLAMKVGFFYNLDPDLKKSYGKFSNRDIVDKKSVSEMVLISYAKNKDSSKIFDGETVIQTCEKYANGGIKQLYSIFFEGDSNEDSLIIEGIIDEVQSKIE